MLNFQKYCFLAILASRCVAQQEIEKYRANGTVDDRFNGKLSNVAVLARTNTSSKSVCAMYCARREDCYSFFHVKGQRKCQLHSTVLDAGAVATVDTHGSKYYKLCPAEPVDCPSSAKALGYKFDCRRRICYRVSTIDSSWLISKAMCESDGGHLLLVQSQKTHDWVVQILSSYSTVVLWWIDGTDALAEGSYITHDRGDFAWYNWGTGQPLGGGYDCLGIYASTWKWVDGFCTGYANILKQGCICQIDV